MPQGPCFNQLWSGILLRNVTPRRSDNAVKRSCREYYRIEPGHIFRGVPITINRAMLAGMDEEAGRILMPFRKPCYGTSLYVIDADEGEIAGLRGELGRTAETVKKQGASKKRKKLLS
jgi:hypothetical protein